MMNQTNRRPSHRQLWFLLLLMPALLFSERTLSISSLDHRIMQMTIVLLVYGFMFYWTAVESYKEI
ncbi:MAG: hypothetical protein KJ069_27270 [Anaerolineae bacterium]|nr:hypothetical protein [Anaerolineae bacterium]